MRKGQNPAKMGIQAYQPSQLGIILLVYIPQEEGYFANSLDIFKHQLASIYHNTSQEFDLYVFDNGSCRTVQNALQNLLLDGWIDWLTLSQHNIGKTGAMNWAFRAMPNQLICYSDGDVYFRPGWYEQSLDILRTFPRCGMVTAQPCFFDSLRGKGHAHLALDEMQQIEITTRLADPSATEEYVRSIGNNQELQARYQKHEWQIVRNTTAGTDAVIGASHFQFLAPKTVLEQITPLPSSYGLNREDDYQIIARIDQLEFLQLSTLKPYIYHMGNILDDITLWDINQDGLKDNLNTSQSKRLGTASNQISWKKRDVFRFLQFISRMQLIKKALLRSYNLLFEYYTRTK